MRPRPVRRPTPGPGFFSSLLLQAWNSLLEFWAFFAGLQTLASDFGHFYGRALNLGDPVEQYFVWQDGRGHPAPMVKVVGDFLGVSPRNFICMTPSARCEVGFPGNFIGMTPSARCEVGSSGDFSGVSPWVGISSPTLSYQGWSNVDCRGRCIADGSNQ